MDGRPTWTDCEEAGDYVVPNVLSPRDLVFRPDIMDETVPHYFIMKLTFFLDSFLTGSTNIFICVKGTTIQITHMFRLIMSGYLNASRKYVLHNLIHVMTIKYIKC